MKVLNALAFAITLGVALVAWGLYTYEPRLLLGTPWGPVHLAFALTGAFLLGAAVVGMYVLTGWVGYRQSLGQRTRELRAVRGELESIKRQHPVETPVIPDRQQP